MSLAGRAIELVAGERRLSEAEQTAGTVPDDGSRDWAIAELRRLLAWSLNRAPGGSEVLRGLIERPDDPGLCYHAQQIFASELQPYPHLVGAVGSFINRANGAPPAWPAQPMPGPAQPMPAQPTTGQPMPAQPPWPRHQEAPAKRRRAMAIMLAVAVLVVGGGTTAFILIKSGPAHPAADHAPVRYQGSLQFGAIDLDQNPPRSTVGNDVVGRVGPALAVETNAIGAVYHGAEPATRTTCTRALANDGAGGLSIEDKVTVGMSFCVSTVNGQTAFLKVTAVTEAAFTANVTVWGQTG